MTEEVKGLPVDEWLDKEIERYISSEGRIKGQYDNQEELQKSGQFNYSGPYSWLHGLVEDHLRLLRAVRIMNKDYNELHDQFATMLGLDTDASDGEIRETAKEMRSIFTEMRRVRGERASKLGNES
jgi:hypothetical protein